MISYEYKLKNFFENQLKDIPSPQVLEFGVKEGRSTKLLLEYCKRNNGELFSVDIKDYSHLFSDKNWHFIKSRDDNFEFLKDKIPNEIDIIYLDSLHEAKHVEKIFYYYFNYLKIGGTFFIDDISWLPYLKNNNRNSFYCEINNKETFEKLLEIYNCNQEKFDIFFTFISSGMCKIKKKQDFLNENKKIFSREFSIKNLIRKVLKR